MFQRKLCPQPCATQRLFLPRVLAEEDAVVYLDTDTLFMRPPEELWAQFAHFGPQTLVAMATKINKNPAVEKAQVGKNRVNVNL